jgi:transposase
MGLFTMSDKEARRPGLIQAALAGKITNVQAANALEMGVRQFRRLRAAYRRGGVGALLHGNRDRPSPRRRSAEERERIVNLMLTTYAGLNDCHLTEKLREVEGLRICREAVRQLRRGAEIAPVHRRRAPKHRARRVREAREGALVLIDGSEFAWLGPERAVFSLLGAIDDATGRIVALHFRPHEDLHGYTQLLRHLVTDHGLPCNFYGDRLSVFVRNDPHWSIAEQLAGERRPTQFGQMLAELAIGFIAAQSPQAKGRIERLWQTLQDRLVQELRLRGLTTVAAAEAFLPAFSADFNRRFANPPQKLRSAWRRPPRHLERILACRYPRRVARDNTVSVAGRWIQIPPGPGGRSWHRALVEVRELLDGRALVLHPTHGVIAEQSPQVDAFTLAPRAKPRRRAALGIDAPRSPTIDDRTPAPVPSHPRSARLGQLTNIRRHPPDHPWRRRVVPLVSTPDQGRT